MNAPRLLRDIGEGGLLRELAPLLERHTEGLPLPTGDDVAVTPPGGPLVRQAWTIDTMVEGTHFRWWPSQTAHALGRKLAHVNLSDLASKGAHPRWALLSCGFPADAEIDAVRQFFSGVGAALAEAGARLVGGDTVLSPQWSLSLALAGELPPGEPIASRSRVRAAMNIYATGWPGESAAGLEVLEAAAPRSADPEGHLVARHLAPEARLREGSALCRAFSDLAMIDVSDGVAHECAELARASGIAIVLSDALLPVSPRLAAFAGATGNSAEELLLYGGEDYELVFATSAAPDDVQAVLTGVGTATPVALIGFAEAGSGVHLLRRGGRRETLGPGGFEHFSPFGPG